MTFSKSCLPWRPEAEVIYRYIAAGLKQLDFKPQPRRNQLLLSAYFLVQPLTLWVLINLFAIAVLPEKDRTVRVRELDRMR